MAGQIASIVSKKLLKETAENRFGQEDPYFEEVPATNLLGRPTTKKRRKAAPDGISDHDARILTKVKRRAYRLVLCLCNCCGIRFGWSSVIGLVPAFGDAADMALALMVIATCNKIEGKLPASLQARMILNVILDFLIGLVPFVGDFADAMYKCNTRNAALLENFLKERGQQNLRRKGETTFRADWSPERKSGKQHPCEKPSRSDQPARATLVKPQPARVREGSGQPRGSSAGKKRLPDLEMGTS